ncbi:putative reverse transcriptase domain-containing protein [Tanacetum coccineum]
MLICCRKMPNTRSGASMTHEEVEELVTRRVAEEMEAREAARTLEPLNENGDEQEGENGGNGNGGNGNGGNGENGNGNRNGNHGMNYGGFMPVARECTFQDFLKCKPHNFSGTEGVVRLTRWFEKIETVFNISNCPSKYQVKYATCTLQDSALTWWNSHKRTIGVDAAYAMNWAGLMRLMTEVYCPRNEIQKMETELWNLTVKGNDLTAYTQRFQELILLCTRMVPDEEDRVERFIGGLPDNIQGNVIAANPARLQDAIRIANQLMDKKLQGYAARSAENKRRMESNLRDNRGQQPSFKRQNTSGQNVARLYTTGTMKERAMLGHYPIAISAEGSSWKSAGNQTRNKNGNQTGGNEATVKAYAIGRGGTNHDSNVVTGTFLLNNCYASMLFDSGADRSFVSTTFIALLDVAPTTLDISYVVELTDRRISETNIVLRGCTLGLLGHPFDIDLMLVELGSFDFIIGMDWLTKYHALIVCDEKVVRIPYGNEVLIIRGDNCDSGSYDRIQKPSGMLVQQRSLNGFGSILTMDFVTKLPRTAAGQDTIWVIVDRLTKFAHFLPMREDDTLEKLTRQYLKEVVSKHGVPVKNGIIELYFVRTEYQLADMFTKALPEDRFKYLVRRIGMRCLTPADLEVLTNETA